MDWKKVEVGNTWDVRTAKAGDEIVGLFVNKQEDVGENHSKLYTLETDKGNVSVWGTSVLDIRLANVKIGEEVKIVYLGSVPSEKRKGKNYHNFDVFHREVEDRPF
jgi:hypothetical protein